MTTPVMLLAKVNDNDLGPSVLDGSWLSSWTNANGSPDPQGLGTINYPTVARTSNPNIFSIYFSAWQDQDIEDMSSIGTIGNGKFTSYPYFSIWRTTTLNGGATFDEPFLIRGNDPTNSTEQKYDYREIETAPWNPGSIGSMTPHTLFNVDSMAGIMIYGGNPGFDDVTWLYEKSQFSGVHQASESGGSAAENYPNPFAARTHFPLVLSRTALVSLRITDLLGKEVAHVQYGMFDTGSHEIVYDASRLGAGSYPYMITMGDAHSGGVLKVLK